MEITLIICVTMVIYVAIICLTLDSIKEKELKHQSETPVYPNDRLAQRISEINFNDDIELEQKIELIKLLIEKHQV